MDAFKIKKDGKILDYRKAETLNLEEVRKYFEQKFEIVDLRQENRHIIGTVRINDREGILKLATTEGIGARTENEKLWNDEFNYYERRTESRVPQNLEDGYYNNLYYIIMEKFDGPNLSKLNGENNVTKQYLNEIIDFSEFIQSLPISLPVNDVIPYSDHQQWFRDKTKSWLEAIPQDIADQHKELNNLWEIVEQGSVTLNEKPRHGDFTPWHLIAMEMGGLGLIDGEHAHSYGVEYYDICYIIQRVHSILNDKETAFEIFTKLVSRNYEKEKLKTILASRAIGGFLDESFNPNSDYKDEAELAKWVLEL